jgi:hypothetical protein
MGAFLSSWEVQGLVRKLTLKERETLCEQYANQMEAYNQEFYTEWLVGIIVGILLIPVLVGFVIIYFVEKKHNGYKQILLKDAFQRALFISGCNPYDG